MEEKKSNLALLKICGFIVDKRNLFFLIFAILAVFAVFSRNWVNVENDMAYYLPAQTETRQGLDLMEEEFVTYGSINVMIANISYEQADKVRADIENMDGVFSVSFDDTKSYYNNGSAKLDITFDYDEKDDECLRVQDDVKDYLEGYDYYLITALGDIEAEMINDEMKVISLIVVIIVLSVLLLTTQAYAEIPVLLITFGGSAILQMGTNFVFGTISFVSNSVTIVLQLALSIDYAIIFLNRYKEEHALYEPREAVIIALSKAIPEIAGSSLTTIGGLIAMTFMQYKMGPDMGIVLIKAIILSLVGVFLLMPGVIMLFSDLMEKTKHKNFIPQIPFVGKFAYKTRYIIAPIFIVMIVAGYIISSKTNYVFGDSTITTPIENDMQKAKKLMNENFGATNLVAMIVPTGNYETERRLINDLELRQEVDHCQGLSNIEALNGYTLTDKLTPRQFSELIDLDYEVAKLIYAAYAINDEDYAKAINGLESYGVPLIDMFMFVKQEVDEGYVTLDDDMMDTLNDAYRSMDFGKKQLKGENYSRILVYLTLPEEDAKTYEFLDEMHALGKKYYPEGKVLLCGNCVSQYDLKSTFGRDNNVVNIMSILVVLVVLLFTFKSAGMPVLLILVIQGSIWINFSCSAVLHQNIFFLSYLIVSSIQMGANIDYAIVIASRYTELRESMTRPAAIIDTMNLSFPTIVTSGSMLALAGITIGKLTSNAAIFNIGQALGRGTIISIAITMFVLPQVLLVGDAIIAKTAFVMNMPIRTKEAAGYMKVDGVVRGHINGMVTGTMHAIVKGDISAYVEAGDVTPLTEEEYARFISLNNSDITEIEGDPEEIIDHEAEGTSEKETKEIPKLECSEGVDTDEAVREDYEDEE